MMTADLTRCTALASVPLAAVLGRLTFGQLCLVGVVQTAATIAFNAASTAHLKNLVVPQARVRAAARLETTDWLSQSAGPPTGGLLITALGPTATLAVDALSFLLSALGIRRIHTPEPPPPARTDSPGRLHELASGWRHILTHPGLRPLFWNAMLFGGAIMATSPLLAVLMLRELRFTPWQYGLALGLPCLGGVMGSRLAVPLTRRLGPNRVLLLFGTLRTLWTAVPAWLPPGPLGLIALTAADTAVLFAAGVFNPAFTTYRMDATSDPLMARVVTAWSVTSKTVQPAFMTAGGLLAAVVGVRTTILIAGVLCLASTALLPWRALRAGTPVHAETPVPGKPGTGVLS
jgi:predicted MFS family arabinose efflux permease